MQKKLLTLVEKLKETVAGSGQHDETLIDLVDQLDAYIETHDAQPPLEDDEDIRDTLLVIEARLKASHPLATRVSESIVELLAGMGI